MINEYTMEYWYYTLSTIPQVLASILALAGLFAVLVLEGLIKNIRDYRGRGLEKLPEPDNKKSTKEIIEALKKYSKKKNPEEYNIRKDLEHFFNRWKKLKRQVKWPGIFTSITIIIAIFSLYLSDWIFESFDYIIHLSILLFVILLTLISIGLILRTCWEILTDSKIFE